MRAYRKIDEPYELKIEGGRLVLLGVGAVLTLVLVFLVGVLVGKGLWGAKGGSTAALLATAPASPAAEPTKPQYTFYKDLTRPDAEVQAVQPPAAERPETAAGTPVSAPAAAVASPAPTAPAALPNLRPQPTAGAAVAPPPVSPAKVESPAKLAPAPPAAQEKPASPKVEAHLPTPSFTVQVGSFRDRASADDQAKKIIGQGVGTQVVLVSVEGRTWYRVQVGRFDTRADAEAHYQKKLRPKGIQGFVTAR